MSSIGYTKLVQWLGVILVDQYFLVHDTPSFKFIHSMNPMIGVILHEVQEGIEKLENSTEPMSAYSLFMFMDAKTTLYWQYHKL